MRYLRAYKESVKINYDNILQDIEDILLPIGDMGYNIKVEIIRDYKVMEYVPYHIFINVVDYGNEPLLFDDVVEDEFDRLFDYLKQNDIEINQVYYKKVEPDGRIFNRNSRDSLNISYFGINYLKKYLMNEKIAFLSFELKVK